MFGGGEDRLLARTPVLSEAELRLGLMNLAQAVAVGDQVRLAWCMACTTLQATEPLLQRVCHCRVNFRFGQTCTASDFEALQLFAAGYDS